MCDVSYLIGGEGSHALKVPAALTIKRDGEENKRMIQMESLVEALRPMFPFISCFFSSAVDVSPPTRPCF